MHSENVPRSVTAHRRRPEQCQKPYIGLDIYVPEAPLRKPPKKVEIGAQHDKKKGRRDCIRRPAASFIIEGEKQWLAKSIR
jgi:hypothetical protein